MTEFWKGKRVAVTGGSGLMGTPMIRKLKEMGAAPRNLDLPEWDVTNPAAMLAAMSYADICIHLAAMSHVEDSRNNPLLSWQTNVAGTWNVLDACRTYKVGAVVVASSNHVYGKQEVFPVPETAQLNQLDTYSATKVCVDYITRAYAHNYGLPTAVIRNTNCFGPNDPHSSHIIPGTILSILVGEAPVIRSTGLVKKGYLYVDDVVDAYLLVAEKIYTGTTEARLLRGKAFNVGAPPISSLDLVRLIMGVMGKSSEESVSILGKTNDQHDEMMDSSRITALGWEPKYSLTEGLEVTIEWFRAQDREHLGVTA